MIRPYIIFYGYSSSTQSFSEEVATTESLISICHNSPTQAEDIDWQQILESRRRDSYEGIERLMKVHSRPVNSICHRRRFYDRRGYPRLKRGRFKSKT